MKDLFSIRSGRQRTVVVGALLVYVALFVTELSTGNEFAGAVSDLLIGALVLTASVVIARRAGRAGNTALITMVTVATLTISGLSIGYQGLARLDLVTPVAAIEFAGSLALLVAVALYFYDQYA